jgi:hypothetical protein
MNGKARCAKKTKRKRGGGRNRRGKKNADRKLAEKLAVADARVRKQPAARGLKRKGDVIAAGPKDVKRLKDEGETSISDMKEQEENSQPAWSHHTLFCGFGACSEKFFKRINCDDSDFDLNNASDF